MAGGNLRKYVQPLPVPGAGIVVATPTASNEYSFTQRPLDVQLHPDLPATPVWAYDDGSGLAGQAGSFGMAVVAQSGEPLRMSFTHQLPAQYPNWIPVDTRLTPRHDAEVRLMTHLHGGFVEAASDGNPAITPLGFGPGQSQTVVSIRTRRRRMPASLLWFHDHGLGTTRLNVFAGLAAAYILRDEYDTAAEPNPIGIPGGAYEIPLVIQDRQFNRDGTFRYPISEVPEATWIGEYFGDVMLVNGKVWPFLELEPRMYRFRILNGCNARILDLSIGGQKLWQIGAEGGMWDRPVPVQRLVLAPAERADVLVDFRKLAGARLVVKNHNPTKPVSTPAPSLEQVMQIRANSSALPLTCSLKRFEHRSSNVPSRTTSGKSQKGSADNPTMLGKVSVVAGDDKHSTPRDSSTSPAPYEVGAGKAIRRAPGPPWVTLCHGSATTDICYAESSAGEQNPCTSRSARRERSDAIYRYIWSLDADLTKV